MNNTLIFLRHGQTKVDSNVPISEWVLSDAGKEQAEKAAQNPEFQDVDVVVISTEEKAYETALPLIERLRKAGKKFDVVRSKDIAELQRDAGGHLDKEEYERAAKEALTNRDVSTHNWETAHAALERFSIGVANMDAEHSNKTILFIGHGYTFGMYFAKQLGKLDQSLHERIHRSGFCDWGVIRDGNVLRDLGLPAEPLGEKLI